MLEDSIPDNKLPINGIFGNDELEDKFDNKQDYTFQLKYKIKEHAGFEIVELPDGNIAKWAYKKAYDAHMPDIDIECDQIAKFEEKVSRKYISAEERKLHREELKFHYKQAASLISPHFAAGWNRWSENILDLFLSDKLHKILWGNGNCGKSAIMALLLYIKWRVNPSNRMIVIASKIVADASARVFGYIKEIHLKAPPSAKYDLKLVDNQKERGVYCMIEDRTTGKLAKDDRACIVNLPVKVSAKTAEVGSNLLGKHPNDRLILAFDEAQELPGLMLEMKIFLNWYTNTNLDIYGWGNPTKTNFYASEEHDLLFKLGAGHLSLKALKEKEKKASVTSWWHTADTQVLHFSMLDSPKDDIEEQNAYVYDEVGNKKSRLWFLGGQDTAEVIAEKTNPASPSWFSQVLGFPFIDTTGNRDKGVMTPFMIRASKDYPLLWKTPEHQLEYFMGVDPAVTGQGDDCTIVIGKMGVMMDGRVGVDLMSGKLCRKVKYSEHEDFVDTTIETMYALSQQHKIPLKNIAIETHGVGEVYKYAIQRHIEGGKWANDYRTQNYFVVNPTKDTSSRPLFQSLEHFKGAREFIANASTEYWYAVRCAVITRQIFNIPDYILQQFYSRNLITNASGTKVRMEGKKDMLKRGVKSPNDADALCNMFELMRNRGFRLQYYKGAKYSYYYGQEYDNRENQKVVNKRLGIVSNLLQINMNMGDDEDRRRGKNFSVSI